MASKKAVARMLAVMHEGYPTRPITKNTPQVWFALFRDVADDALLAAVFSVCNEPGRTFFPTPGDIRAYLAPPKPVINADEILNSIAGMSQYTPHGYLHARPEQVRARHGAAVAIAYGQVGANRLFSDSETTRSIAERDFAIALKGEVDSGAEMFQLPAAVPPLMLQPGVSR